MSTLLKRRPPRERAPEPLDRERLARDLGALADACGAREHEVRAAIVPRLRQALAEGREVIRAGFEADARGTQCAERLSALMDDVLRVLLDFVVDRLYPSVNPSAAERLAIAAVGGYGRGTLAPHSDIDLLFLLPYKQTAWGESVVEAMLYVLWDLGLKVGHATRSVDESLRQARADMTIRTSILEARWVAGDRGLVDELIARFDKEIVEGTAAEFVTAKLAERDARYSKGGGSRYVVEPNVKEGKGGLRDLNTLFWIAKYVYRIRDPKEVVRVGLFDGKEFALFTKCEDFLWAVRCHLHFLAGRAEERLSFDVQREIALRLGYTEHPGLRDVERFMKHYFLVAKDVGDLTAIVCAAMEARQQKPLPKLDRFLKTFRRSKAGKAAIDGDFVLENGRLSVRDDGVFERNPVNLIRLFHVANARNLALHPDAMRLLTRSLKLVDAGLRENPEANRLFLEILTARHAPDTTLRRMNEVGLLGRFIPEFGRVVAMMQFNMYHHFTVDEHLIQAIGVLSEIEHGRFNEDLPLATEIMPTLQNRAVLYVGLLLHDIAKGRPEDHSVAGAKIARRLCPRLGLSPAETETVAWLVEHHLVMSMTAQSRDLSDPRTIEDFVQVVQSLERLKLLLILTVADIKAVGPGVWNGWKGQLLRSLYWETELVLTGGNSQANRSQRVAQAQRALSDALKDWPAARREAYVARHYPAYWLKVDPDRLVAHARFVAKAEDAGQELATDVKTDGFHGVTELTVLAPDHPRLLSVIAGACAIAGANIVDAHIHTTTDGRALDSIFISRAFDNDDDELRRAGRIAAEIEKALKGDIRLPEVVAKRTRQGAQRARAFDLEPQVLVTNGWSERYTVIEVSGLDRPGLLFDMTTAISRLSLNITSAHVATFGERAVDVFYVTDLTGAKVTGAARQSAIRKNLRAVFEPQEEAAERRRVVAAQ